MAQAKNDVEAFRLWATSIGCPQGAIISEEALKSVFKSQQRDIFETMMKRIRPRQQVDALRRHILLREVEKLGNQIGLVPASRRAFLPQKLQTYLKAKELEKKRDEIKARLEEYKKEYETLAATIKSKNIQILNLEHKNSLHQAKIDLLTLKGESLAKDIKKEEDIKACLQLYMPVKLNAKNANEHAADVAVQKALEELQAFDDWSAKNSNSLDIKVAKERLWSKLRSLFSNVPNFLLFNSIMRLKDQQLVHVMELNKTKIGDSQLRNLIMKEPMSPFQKELMKLKVDAISLFVSFKEAQKEHESIEEIFFKRFNFFVNELQKKVYEFNPNESEEHIDEVISEYMMQQNWRTSLKTQNECFQTQIDNCRNQKCYFAKKLENHEMLLGAVKQAYGEVDASINKVKSDMAQLNQIKQKIIYSRNLFKHKSNDLHVQSNSSFLNPNKAGIAISVSNYIGSSDSFEYGTDNVLCSTKLDLDSFERSFALGDTTLITSNEPRSVVPPHTLELSTFVSMPLEKFSNVSKESAFYFAPNPFVTESHELSSTLQLAPGTLLTPSAALQEVRQHIVWADLIATHSTNLKLDLKMTTVDIQAYKQRSKIQHEQLSELLDKINFMGIRTNRVLGKCLNIYKFIIENPLRHYIPTSIVYNNKTYEDYEAEFKIYKRMLTHGESIK